MLVLAGLAITGMLLLPSLVSKTTQRRNTAEEASLARLEEGFRDYVRLYQIIPGTGTWNTAIASVGGLNATEVNCVFPDFPTDTSVQRVFVIDDLLGGGSPLLPYTQSTNGLTGTATNLLNSRARAMIVSSTKRGLSLPVSSGFITQTNFDAIWNWTYNPASEAPPSGWSSAWTGNGEFLHVKTLYLPNLFSKVTLQNAKFGLGLLNLLTTTLSGQTDYYFLNGAPLTLATTAGVLKQDHVVRGDASFNFGSASGPVIWWQLSQTTWTAATNSGSLGTAGNGTFQNEPSLQAVGPRSPTNAGFPTNNVGTSFDGSDDWVQGPAGALNNVSAFTIAGWIKPSTGTLKNLDLFGQRDVGQIGFDTPAGSLAFWTDAGAKKITYSYPFGAGTWHHIAGVKEPGAMYLYVDGVLVDSRSDPTLPLTSNANAFNVGANVFGAGRYFPGTIDEVIVYDRALSAIEITLLYANQPP